MVEFEIETIDIGLFVRMSSDYVIPIFSDYVILIFKRQEVTYLRTRYISGDPSPMNRNQSALELHKFLNVLYKKANARTSHCMQKGGLGAGI